MTELTQHLNEIHAWLEENGPESVSGFQTGLDEDEVDAVLAELPFAVAQDVRELYAWSSGDEAASPVFCYHSLMSPDRALDTAEFLNAEDLQELRIEAAEPEWLLPLFEADGEYFAVSANDPDAESSAVFHVSDSGDISYAFISLAAMMAAIAECYAEGVYAVGDDGYVELTDMQRFGEIRLKHNFGTAEALFVEGG